MKRLLSPAGGVLVGLLLSLPNGLDLLTASAAHAQSTPATGEAKGERRAIKADDFTQADRAKAYDEAAHQARLEAIESLKQLIKDTDPEMAGDRYPEMLLRLSDLYFEEGRYLYLQEMDTDAQNRDRCFNTPGCNIDTIVTDNTKSREWQEKSIKLNKRILDNYPTYTRADEATFYLAMALNDTGKPDEANAEFARLVRTYTDSQFVPEAYVQIGEYWFERNQAYKALTAYQRAAAFKTHDKYAFANYKLAWCYFNVGEVDKAIETMKGVVMFSIGQTDKKSSVQLTDEALKDLVRFFADSGNIEEAIAWFEKLGKKDLIRDTLKRLAGTYVEQGKFELAIQTYRRLISEEPTGAGAPSYQNEIVNAYKKMGKKQETVDEIDRMLKTYGKSSSWAKANASNQTAITDAADAIDKNLRAVATDYHNEAKKLKSGAAALQAYTLAEQAYRTYLQEYPDSKYSYEMRYSFAELLYTVKKFEDAYDQYMAVVKTDPKGNRSEFCAESAVFSAEKVIDKAGGVKTAEAGNRTQPVQLSEWEAKLLAALDQYTTLYPEGKKVKGSIYKSAYLLYNKNQFKEASDRFRRVIAMDPGSREAEQAANLILDSFNLVEDWNNLKEVSKAFRDQPGLGGAEFKKEVAGVYESASLKLIEVNFAKDQNKATAANAYWAFYQEFPASEKADFALNNASVYYRDTGSVRDSMKMRLEIVNKYPKSKYYKDQVSALGFDYESVADFNEASNYYEKLYALDNKHPNAADAIYSAALFREALGQWEQAIKDYQQYITTYPDKPSINGINIQIGKIYESKEKWAEASKVYLAYFTKPPANATADEIFFCRYRYGLLMDKIGLGAKVGAHWKETLAAYDKAKAAGSPMEASSEFISEIQYSLAESAYQAYLNMKIDGPGDKKLPEKQVNKLLKDQLVAKAKALAEVDKTYTAIVGIGAGRTGLAALVRLGQAYENMADTLQKSYIPSYLTEDQKDLYRMALEDRAYPMIEKAVAAYSAALGKAYDLSIYNDDTANATRRLGVLRPNEFPGLFEAVPSDRFAAPSVYTASFETEP